MIVRNHAATPRPTRVRLRSPAGWRAEPAEASATIDGGGATAELDFTLFVPPDAAPGRVVVTADVEIDGEPRGELAETLLEVLPA